MDEVILVNNHDMPIGTMEKMAAHEQALLHRAFSVFIFNRQGQMLLQQRASTKYHSGGLFTNACCSHPRPNEATHDAAIRRLQEEMGFTTQLQFAFHFTYQAAFANGLTEHEFDHVFVGTYDGEIEPNAAEVMSYCYQSVSEIAYQLQTNPQQYTAWFHIAFPKVQHWLKNNQIA